MPVSELEWAWIAGLFEGEGSIIKRTKSPGYNLVLSMSDKDVVERLHSFVGGHLYVVPPRQSHHKVQYRWELFNRLEVGLVLTKILPYLGERRTAKAVEAITWCYSKPLPRGREHPPHGALGRWV